VLYRSSRHYCAIDEHPAVTTPLSCFSASPAAVQIGRTEKQQHQQSWETQMDQPRSLCLHQVQGKQSRAGTTGLSLMASL